MSTIQISNKGQYLARPVITVEQSSARLLSFVGGAEKERRNRSVTLYRLQSQLNDRFSQHRKMSLK